jgi:hypothetical protein
MSLALTKSGRKTCARGSSADGFDGTQIGGIIAAAVRIIEIIFPAQIGGITAAAVRIIEIILFRHSLRSHERGTGLPGPLRASQTGMEPYSVEVLRVANL